MHNRLNRVAQVGVWGLVLCLLAVMFWPTFGHLRPGEQLQNSCQSNLKQLVLAVKQYQATYGDKYPIASKGGMGWAAALLPYTQGWKNFQCSSTQPTPGLPARLWQKVAGTPRPRVQASTDYWYNARLSGVSEAVVDAVDLTALFGDGTNDGKTGASLAHWPPAWLSNASSPAHRHREGLNVAFADGHVRWYPPEKLTEIPPSEGKPTFLLK